MLTVDFERLDLAPGMTVLDAGCGEGRHTLELRRRGCRAVGVDLAKWELGRARFLLDSLNPAPGESLRLAWILRADTQRLPFADGAFDRVICSEVLEHVASPRRAAGELVRVLKPGGRLAVSVPTAFSEHAFGFASDDYFNTPGGHVRIFTVRRLARLGMGAGLRVNSLHFEHAFHTVYWWVRGVFGLHDEDHPAIRHFRRVLTYAMFSPFLSRAERALNGMLPKAMVMYFDKPSGGRD